MRKNILDYKGTKEQLEIIIQNKQNVCEKKVIPKKDGERNLIAVKPKCEFKKMQKALLDNFLSKIPISPSAKGFLKGSSYINYLEEHIGHEAFLHMDIKDFFDSISIELLRDALKQFVGSNEDEEGYEENEIMNIILQLCTYEEKVPQGFLTSPAVSNIVFRRIDQRITKYCRSYQKERKVEIFYTRYADDLLFSSYGFIFKENKYFQKMIVHILRENGFKCNNRKTIYQSGKISLSGYVVCEDVHLSRKKLKNINTIIAQFDNREKYDDKPFEIDRKKDIKEILKELNGKKMKKANGEIVVFSSTERLAHCVAGYRSYLIEILRAEHEDTRYSKQIRKKIRKLEKILDYLAEFAEEE